MPGAFVAGAFAMPSLVVHILYEKNPFCKIFLVAACMNSEMLGWEPKIPTRPMSSVAITVVLYSLNIILFSHYS